MPKAFATLALLLASSAVLSGCGFLAVDNRDKIARSILTHPGGGANEAALQAAFNTRYPSGTDPKELRELSSRFGGTYTEPSNGAMNCTVPTYSAFCLDFYLRLTISLNPDSTVKAIEVRSGDNTC